MKPRVLLAEHDSASATAISVLLANSGYNVEIASDGEAAFAQAINGTFDFLLVNAFLEGAKNNAGATNGLDLCRHLRQQGIDTALLMIAARAKASDRVAGLQSGADDYLVKPFNSAELIARIEAILRRLRKGRRIPVESFHFGDVEIDFESPSIRKAGHSVSLAQKELDLLRYLINHREHVVTRAEVLSTIWEYSDEVASRTVDVHIAWLRQKLESDPQNPRHIRTLRGQGYWFTA